MKIKEQTRKLAAGCTWVRQGDVDAVWIWFSKSINFLFYKSVYTIAYTYKASLSLLNRKQKMYSKNFVATFKNTGEEDFY